MDYFGQQEALKDQGGCVVHGSRIKNRIKTLFHSYVNEDDSYEVVASNQSFGVHCRLSFGYEGT